MNKLLAVVVTLTIMIGVVLYSKRDKEEQPKAEVHPPPSGQVQPPEFVLPPVVPSLTREQARDSITAATCRDSVYHLCSDELEGRMTGKKGNVKAAEWIKAKFEAAGLQTQYQRFPYRAGVNPGPKNEVGDAHSNNVIGVLPGSGDRFIIVGAHFDHLGYGPTGSRWGQGKIHPGADDNATGTTLVIEIADRLGKMKYRPKHTLVFIAFSGEEMGLIGSKYYVQNPIFPLNRLDFMFNTDMIGRMNGKTSLRVGGSAKLNPFMERLNRSHPIKMMADGTAGGGSDHAPFVEKGIPSVCFHSGMHNDYHTPSDSADRIDYDGMHKVVRYVFDLVIEYDQR